MAPFQSGFKDLYGEILEGFIPNSCKSFFSFLSELAKNFILYNKPIRSYINKKCNYRYNARHTY